MGRCGGCGVTEEEDGFNGDGVVTTELLAESPEVVFS